MKLCFLFGEMQSKGGIEPNKVSLITVLPACSSVGGFLGGKQVHGFAVRKELNHEVSMCHFRTCMLLLGIGMRWLK